MTTTQTVRPASPRQVPTRRISFEQALADVPKHFAADGDLILSHLAASLSALFPDGEDFFVRSVRSFRDQVTDPELKRQVAGFIGQEAMHGRQHRAFNARLDELGYPTKRTERITRRALGIAEKRLSPEACLAITAALEHFTATLAELLLTSQETRDLFAHDEVRNLFLWHALEEAEHKAVAFDVYRAVGGTEGMRRRIMNAVTVIFVVSVASLIVGGLILDRETYRRGRLRRSWRRFWRSPIMRREVWRQLREYNRHGFHPEDRDTAELVEQWRTELFGAAGTLNDKLATTTPSGSAAS